MVASRTDEVLTGLLVAFSVAFLRPPKVVEGHKAPVAQPRRGLSNAINQTETDETDGR